MPSADFRRDHRPQQLAQTADQLVQRVVADFLAWPHGFEDFVARAQRAGALAQRGEPVGAINRIPASGQVRSNLRVGGTAAPVELTDRDREICAAIGPELKRRGLIFVGIDVIGDCLTEINVTSPTGAQQLKRFTGVDAAALMWDVIEKKRAWGRARARAIASPVAPWASRVQP